jgi:hypothetical protein
MTWKPDVAAAPCVTKWRFPPLASAPAVAPDYGQPRYKRTTPLKNKPAGIMVSRDDAAWHAAC